MTSFFDDSRVIAGQGTIGLELAEQVGEAIVLVPIGGAGPDQPGGRTLAEFDPI